MATAGAVKAGAAYVELSVKDQLTKGLDAASARLKSFGYGVAAVGAAVSGVGAAITAPFLKGAQMFAESGRALDQMSTRTGIAVTALSEFSYASKVLGLELSDAEIAIKKMQKTIGEAESGSKSSGKAFDRIGISLRELQTLSPDKQFERIALAITEIEDPAQRTRAAIAIFGRSGTSILPLIKHFGKLREEARRFGIVTSKESVESAVQLNMAMKRLSIAVESVFKALGKAVAPSLKNTYDKIAEVVFGISRWIKSNQNVVVTIFMVGKALTIAGTAITALGLSIVALGAVLGGLGTIISTVVGAFGIFATAIGFVLSPLGMLIAFNVALVSSFAATSRGVREAAGNISDAFGAMVGDAKTAFGAIVEALQGGDLTQAAKILWATMKLIWARGIAAIAPLWAQISIEAGIVWDEVVGSAQVAWSWLSTSFLKALEVIRTAMLQVGAFISETFWKAVQSVADAFAWLADKTLKGGYALGLSDKDAEKLHAWIVEFQGGADAFIKAQKGLSSAVYGEQLKKSLDRQKGLETEYQQSKEKVESDTAAKRAERYKIGEKAITDANRELTDAQSDFAAETSGEIIDIDTMTSAWMAEQRAGYDEEAASIGESLMAGIDAAVAGAETAVTAAGSFGGMNLPAVMAADRSGAKTAENTAAMVREQEKTNKLLEDYEMEFA